MQNRERIKNTALVTDLLNTYLTNQAEERKRYEEAASPKTYTVGGNIIEVSPDGETNILYESEKKPKTYTSGGNIIQKNQETGEWETIFSKEDKRRIVEGKDGFKYYEDTGERALPNVKNPPEKKKKYIIHLI